jgi:hypothetical protein
MISLVSIFFLMSIPLIAAATSASLGPVYVSIDGKNVVAIGERWEYVVNVIGGPGSQPGGNFSYKASILAAEGGGQFVDPSNGISSTGVFRINLTAPSDPQDITLRLNVTSSYEFSTERAVKDFAIKVLKPIVILATIKNTGDVGVRGVPVSFHVDGVKVYDTTVDIDPLSSKTVRYNWTDPEMRQGEHVITVMLDPDNKLVEFETGGSTYTTTIFVGATSYGSTDAMLGVLFVASVVLSLMIYNRPKKRRMR